MARLPTVSGDSGTWGTVLNDYLTESASAMALDSSPSVGTTTFDVGVVPSGLKVGSAIAIDAYTTECELRAVTAISSNTITVAALKYAHASGDAVVQIQDGVVPIKLYAVPTDATNGWAMLQRCFLEAVVLGLVVDGLNARVDISQPLCFLESTRFQRLWVRTRAADYAPADPDGACVMLGSSQGQFPFTASAATNIFTTTSSHGMSAYHEAANSKVVFHNPYGETLPGGLTSGKVYFIDTVPTATTFTVSATAGGSIHDVTVDGTGNVILSVFELSRAFWHGLRIDLLKADVNGLLTSLQQPAVTYETRIEMETAATVPTYGWHIGGQISHHYSVEINPNDNTTGLTVSGAGISVWGYNCNGTGTGDTGFFLGGDNNCIHNPWTETCAVGGEIGGIARGIVIGGTWLGSTYTPSVPILQVTSTTSSYELGVVRASSGTGQIVVDDTARGFQILTVSGSTGDSDSGSVFKGLYQSYGSTYGPVLKERLSQHFSADGTVNRISRYCTVDATGAARTITIPTAVGWGAWTTTICHYAGTNNVTLDPAGSETIGGSSTYVLRPGEVATLYSNGANYVIMESRGALPGTIQTYTPTNVSTDRAFDADTVAIAELADVVGTLIADLQNRKIIA